MTTYVLAAIILIQSILWHIERKDLYNRIMCKDINDYKRIDEKAKTPAESSHNVIMKGWRNKGKQ